MVQHDCGVPQTYTPVTNCCYTFKPAKLQCNKAGTLSSGATVREAAAAHGGVVWCISTQPATIHEFVAFKLVIW